MFKTGIVISSLFSKQLGNRRNLISGTAMLVIGSGIVVLSSLSLSLYMGFFIMGAGLGFYEVSGNAIIPEMYLDHKESSRFLLLAGFCHSLGAMISPVVSGKLLSIDINWRMLYIGCAAFAVALFVYLVLNIPKDHYNKREETAGSAYFLKLFFGDGMPIYCIGIAIYVSLEIGIASWMVTYGSEVKGLQPDSSFQHYSRQSARGFPGNRGK